MSNEQEKYTGPDPSPEAAGEIFSKPAKGSPLAYLTQGWLVLVLALAFGGALAAVEITLRPQIDQNKLDDTRGAIPTLVPGAVTGEKAERNGLAVWRATNAAGEQVGWVIPASGQGFADKIELLVGVDLRAQRITGLYVLEQKETPGLGDNITREAWRSQFAGQPAAPLRVTKATAGEHEIAAVTGATVSSQSVVDIVNKVIGDFRKALESE